MSNAYIILDIIRLYIDQIFSINHRVSRKLQSTTPGWVDFVVLVGLVGLLYYILRILKGINEKWKKILKRRIEKALQLRNELADDFRKINGYSWDYAIVYKVRQVEEKVSPSQIQFSFKEIQDRFASSGLETKLFYSAQNDEIYCKIRAPLDRLLTEADRINYPFLMEPNLLANRLRLGNMIGDPSQHWPPVEIPVLSYETKISPYEYIFIDYDKEKPINTELIKKWKNGTIFRGVDRIKLIASIIAANRSQGGCQLNIYKLISQGCISTFFPLHDVVEIKYLEERWLRFFQPPWLQHVDDVKDYFGEKITFFFLWLGHYTTWLIPASVIGFIGYIGIASDNNDPSAPIVPFFATFIAIWSTLFLEFWKRKEKRHALKWGTLGFEDAEQDRPEYYGSLSFSPVDGRPITYFPPLVSAIRAYQSAVIISILVMTAIGVIVGIFALRIILTESSNASLAASGGIIASIINAIQIQVLNSLFGSVATYLNDYENHRTDTQYEDALISKTFAFQFVNSFASLFYIAFIKPFVTFDSCKVSCMYELQTALGTIFLTRLATGSLLQVLIPYINKMLREESETKGAKLSDLTPVEEQFVLQEYHVILGPFSDFADMTIQFAYATMFIAAYPLATVLALVNNYVALRIGAWKLLQLYRRPEPRSCEDIGTWYTILEIISFAAVLVNSGLVAFTSTLAIDYQWDDRVWIFIAMSTGIFAIKIFVSVLIPDVPIDVEIQVKRRKYILDKIVRNIPDENNNFDTDVSKAEFAIRLIDDDPL